MNEIYIKDDFDLEKIRMSGQCFRVKRLENNHGDSPQVYSFIHKDRYLEIQKETIDKKPSPQSKKYIVSCTKEEWNSVWSSYFDIKTDYSKIRRKYQDSNEFTRKCLEFGEGLRILRQDPWEMLITFIVSQRRSMQAISSSIEKLCMQFGDIHSTSDTIYGREVAYNLFPSPEQLASAKTIDIAKTGVGYRDKYIKNAAEMVASGDLDLTRIASLDDEYLFEELCRVKGVGTKVANCVMLFGYHRISRAPVDVWIERVIKQDFAGKDPFPEYGNLAGIIQQYFFFYKTQIRQ